jgi:hypothetical protein
VDHGDRLALLKVESHLMTAYALSATTISCRPGHQRWTIRSICRAQSVRVLCRVTALFVKAVTARLPFVEW